MQPPVVKLQQHEKADVAASAFERYDLVSAPVVDTNDRLVGRVTVDEVLDFVRESGEEDLLAQAGLREEEDVFASVWASFQNRWAWLAINLVTAFIASRVIGVFEGSIEKLVALAALMPIVAGIGGNSGNQTITMIVRAVGAGPGDASTNARQLIRKEITVSLVNGVIWGGVMGLVAMVLYKDVALGLVMVLRDDAQPDARGADGRADPDDDAEGRPRSGGRLVGADHRGHRLGRLLHLPRPRHAVPGVTPPGGMAAAPGAAPPMSAAWNSRRPRPVDAVSPTDNAPRCDDACTAPAQATGRVVTRMTPTRKRRQVHAWRTRVEATQAWRLACAERSMGVQGQPSGEAGATRPATASTALARRQAERRRDRDARRVRPAAAAPGPGRRDSRGCAATRGC